MSLTDFLWFEWVLADEFQPPWAMSAHCLNVVANKLNQILLIADGLKSDLCYIIDTNTVTLEVRVKCLLECKRNI